MTASFVPDGFVNIDRYELEFADSEGMGTVQTVSDKTQFAAGEKVVLILLLQVSNENVLGRLIDEFTFIF